MYTRKERNQLMRGTNMHLSFGLTKIFEDASFSLEDDDKVGLVGVNGAGKTTFFRLLLGEVSLDSGQLSFNKNRRVGYLPQTIDIEEQDTLTYDYIYDGRPIRKINAELDEIYERLKNEGDDNRLLKRMGKLQDLLEYYEVYQAEDIMLELIINMHIDLDLLSKPIKNLSGGEKSKVAFARLLFSNPEILCLDEPTNHLDQPSKAFVTEYLKNYHGQVIIISHDVPFLNAIVAKIMYIDKANHKIKVYEGIYDDYIRQYNEEKRLKELNIRKQEKEISALEAFILKAKQASQTNHALKKMKQDREAKLAKKKSELIQREKTYKKMKMHIAPKREGGLVPLEVEHLKFAYPNSNLLYDDLSFRIKRNERFLIVGENGVGKSTLLKLIMGLLAPQEGRIRYNPKTDIAYYAQELESLDYEKSIYENVDDKNYNEWELRAILANFLFFENDINKKVKVLSPGERARVALCKILLQKANLLILDEPTNHLDPETQMAIALNFKMFEGTIILVSHNPAFVSQIGIDRMLILPYGRIDNYSEELLDYYYFLNTKKD